MKPFDPPLLNFAHLPAVPSPAAPNWRLILLAVVLLAPVGPVGTAAEPAGRGSIEVATPTMRRFVSEQGYEVTFPDSWRVLNREGFDLIIDKQGGAWEAATLSFAVINVAPKAQEAIAADLAGDGARFVVGFLGNAQRRFPDAKVIRSGSTVLGNTRAVEVVSTYSINNPGSRIEVLGWLIVALKDGKLVRVQFEATGAPRGDWLKEAGVIISSFMYH